MEQEFTQAKMFFGRAKPKMFDKEFIRAYKLLSELEKKSCKDVEQKKKTFIWLVDKIYGEQTHT